MKDYIVKRDVNHIYPAFFRVQPRIVVKL